MNDFITKTLSPEIFWSSISAISTLLALLVALFLPVYTKYKEYKNMKELIYKEFYSNLKVLSQIDPFDSEFTIPNTDKKVSTNITNLSKFMHLKINIWDEYKFKISLHEAKTYKDLEIINLLIEEIVGLVNKDSLSKNLEASVRLKYINLIELINNSKYKDKLNKTN